MKIKEILKAAVGPVFAIIAALIVGGIILLIIGFDPLRTYSEGD